MTVMVTTFAGEKITIRHKSLSEALAILEEGGVSEGWIYELQAAQDEVREQS